jgi:hypothetical protein
LAATPGPWSRTEIATLPVHRVCVDRDRRGAVSSGVGDQVDEHLLESNPVRMQPGLNVDVDLGVVVSGELDSPVCDLT